MGLGRRGSRRPDAGTHRAAAAGAGRAVSGGERRAERRAGVRDPPGSPDDGAAPPRARAQPRSRAPRAHTRGPAAPPARPPLSAVAGRQSPGREDVCPVPLSPRPRTGPERRPKPGAHGAATETARSQRVAGPARGGGAFQLPAGAPHPPLAQTLVPSRGPLARGPRAEPAASPQPPGLRAPGKQRHTCALPRAPAAQACQRGQEEKGPRTAKFATKNEMGRAQGAKARR